MLRLFRYFAAASILISGGCNLSENVASIPYCEDTPVSRLKREEVKSITYHLGNEDHRQTAPARTLSSAKSVNAALDVVMGLTDYWYQPAGETYDPASIRKIGETTAVFRDDEKELGFISIGVNYIEGHGCGVPIVRHISPEDRAALLNLLGHPAPGWNRF